MTLGSKLVWGSVGIIAMVGGAWYYRSAQTPEAVPTETVRRGDVVETVSVTGELLPGRYADLSFKNIGRIAEILVKEGESVASGQVIARLDASVLRSQWEEAKIVLAIAEENEKLARRGWDDLKPEERAAKKLASEQARENVRTIGAQIEEYILHSPFDGIVSRVDARSGETATIGSRVARVVQHREFVIEARVPESDIAKISVGMDAQVTFDAFSSSEVFEATVAMIDPASTVVQDVVSYVVTFALRDQDDRLKEGMTANLDIVSSRRTNILVVPFRAIFREGDETYVQKKNVDGTLARVTVVTGVEGDEGMTEILSGLAEGDEVAIIPRQP